jgi:hypothetical protein
MHAADGMVESQLAAIDQGESCTAFNLFTCNSLQEVLAEPILT